MVCLDNLTINGTDVDLELANQSVSRQLDIPTIMDISFQAGLLAVTSFAGATYCHFFSRLPLLRMTVMSILLLAFVISLTLKRLWDCLVFVYFDLGQPLTYTSAMIYHHVTLTNRWCSLMIVLAIYGLKLVLIVYEGWIPPFGHRVFSGLLLFCIMAANASLSAVLFVFWMTRSHHLCNGMVNYLTETSSCQGSAANADYLSLMLLCCLCLAYTLDLCYGEGSIGPKLKKLGHIVLGFIVCTIIYIIEELYVYFAPANKGCKSRSGPVSGMYVFPAFFAFIVIYLTKMLVTNVRSLEEDMARDDVDSEDSPGTGRGLRHHLPRANANQPRHGLAMSQTHRRVHHLSPQPKALDQRPTTSNNDCMTTCSAAHKSGGEHDPHKPNDQGHPSTEQEKPKESQVEDQEHGHGQGDQEV